MAYRFYVADSLRIIPQNGHLAKTLREIYYDRQPADTRTGEQIAEDIIKRAGLRFKE